MEKLGCALGIIIFAFVTILILTTDIGDFKHTVQFSNQNLAINQQQNATVQTSPVTNTDQKINTKEISYDNINFDIETKELNNSEIPINNNSAKISNSGQRIDNQNIKISQNDINNLKAGFKNSRNFNNRNVTYNNSSQNINNYNTNVNNYDEYRLKNIDWSTWKSNFVNKITDDTFYIPELNNYPTGTLFHYSFNVDNTGKVYNVKVTSLTISKEDKEKIAKMIENYSYTDITKFPANSKRKTAKISAILLFSNETEYSSPSDFHDLEQIKIKL